MAQLIEDLRDLQSLPESIHLLCPLQSREDTNTSGVPTTPLKAGEGADTETVDVAARESEANVRKEKFLCCLPLLGYSEEEAGTQQAWIRESLDRTLENCDQCIHAYYKGKTWLLDNLLAENNDEGAVQKFDALLTELDLTRIKRGLGQAGETLRNLPPERRLLPALDRVSLLSIFETLSCNAMLQNETLLTEYFDEPFKMVQTKRVLKLNEYVPASTHFLFSSNQTRCAWAMHAWTRMPTPPTSEEFDWAVKPPLYGALKKATEEPYNADAVQKLWRGLHLIMKKLTKEQITHDLRSLDIDACRLSVEHLGVQGIGLRYLLSAIQTMLEKAPSDFWDAMQTISPQAIIEQIFYNPQYERFLLQTSEDEVFEKSTLKDLLSWISPFMSSLKGAQQPQACRFLVFQLLGRLQDEKFPNVVRYHCFQTGLTALMHTLRTFTEHESSRGSVARIVLSDTLEVVSDKINQILNPPQFTIEGSKKEIDAICVEVVRNTLALECQSLKTDYEVILRQSTLHHGVSTYSAQIWDAVVRHLREDNLALSKAALLGILPLVGLEKFQSRGEASEEKTHFNVIYENLTHLSCQILERLADFRPEHLDNLFRFQDTSSALISALFSADLNTYQAAVSLIKSISGQAGRREAISHLLQSFCHCTMYGLSWSFRRISNMKTFASAPRMLMTGTDVVSVLCDSQTGILRTRKLADRKEAFSLQKLWEYQWQALTTIFYETESWHGRGNDKAMMLEFCRDTMQFADLLFDQYGVFASAITEVDPNEATSTQETLLKSPTTTMSGMVKWLRLKDEYLAEKLVGLVSKLLRRLGELNVKVSQDALAFIEGVAIESKIKTILDGRKKAELVRALEAYLGEPIVTPTSAQPVKRQSSITAFARPIDTLTTDSSRKSSDVEEFGDEDLLDDELLELSGSVELNKARLAAKAQALAKRAARPSAKAPGTAPKLLKSIPKPAVNVESFREKREREKEAKKKRDMAELARLKKNIPARGVAEQTAGQGSGLNGLGVKGKDHRVPGDSMMVSSGSESDESSDEELAPELFGSKTGATPEAVKAYQESKRKALLHRGPVKKIKQVRTAKDMRARLSPDLSSLHRTLLSWDFFATGDLPPSSEKRDYTLVSNTFRDPIEYQRTFEPLLVLEAWQAFQSNKEDGTFKPFEIKIANRLSVDAFVEVSTTMSMTEARELGLGEADMILLSQSKKPHVDSSAPHCLARVSRTHKKGATMEISFRVNTGNPMLSSLSPNATISGVKVTSLTPLEREYGALMALQYYDLCEEVIKAQPSPILNYTEQNVRGISETYKLNSAQAKAVKSALDNDAFTLIQGPPGSGKTKTIVALVGAMMTGNISEQGTVAISRPSISITPAVRTTQKKLLVCAPSNAAVDELVMRFKEGVKSLHGRTEKLNVIRLGRSDAINKNVLDVTLDELVTTKLNQAARKDPKERDLQSYYMEHQAVSQSFQEARSRIDSCRSAAQEVPIELEKEFDLLKRKKAQLSQAIDTVRDKNNSAVRDADLARRKVQQEILDGAHVICSTLSGSGHDMFQKMSIEFETVIIDEAAQSIELSALIPLKYGCSKCILVGDPKQLPPTVLSKVASRFQYEQSLFVRMQANHPRDVHLLDTQYRMHPEISRFPSAAFYDEKLRDGPDMAKLRIKPWHQSELLGPYRFFDVQGMHASAPKGHSLVNMAEIQVSMQLYERLITDFRGYDFSGKIGIITPYKGQLKELKNRFAAKYGNSIFTAVEFNTTDAFQGRESEVIIFSCVRASDHGIGFLADIRRMNVGLTRAKCSLWVLGNSRALSRGEFWNQLIVNSKQRSLYTEGDINQMLQRPQFTGYRDVEMDGVEANITVDVDVDTDVKMESAPTSAVSKSSSDIPSRWPSSSVGLPSASGGNTPTEGAKPQLPDGPSGGGNGLNENATCGLCGSYEHMTHNCDNLDAKQTAHGTCRRCGDPSHAKRDCNVPRCLECGRFGHIDRQCKSGKPLPAREKARIAKFENAHQDFLKQKVERRREHQLGDHDRKVPVLQVSTPPPPKAEGPNSSISRSESAGQKRKRPGSPPRDAPKGSKQRKSDQYEPPRNAPNGPQGKRQERRVAPPKLDLLNSSGATSTGRTGKSPAPPTGPLNAPPNPTLTPGAAQQPGPVTASDGARPRPPNPQMRKKKPVDPFIKPKRR